MDGSPARTDGRTLPLDYCSLNKGKLLEVPIAKDKFDRCFNGRQPLRRFDLGLQSVDRHAHAVNGQTKS